MIDREEFIRIYDSESRRLTGRSVPEEIPAEEYEVFCELVQVTASKNGIPVFNVDGDGNLDWHFKPVRP